MKIVKVKQNDNTRRIEDILKYSDEPLDLTGATVFFVIKKTASSQVHKRNAVIVEATAGSVFYDLVQADTNIVGRLLCEWEVNYPSGRVLTVPDDGYNVIDIIENLG